MKNNLFWVLGVVAVVSVGAACSSSSEGGGGSGGEGGDSSGAGKGGSDSGGKGGSSSGGSGGVAAGTGGSGGMSAGGTSGTMTYTDVKVEEYPKAVATVACTQFMKCACPMVEAVTKCVSKRAPIVMLGVKDLKASIAANTATYDGAKLASCLNKHAGLACDAKQAEIDALKDCAFFKGTVANGGVCANGFDCSEGYCGKPEGKTTMECIARKAVDVACAEGGECTSGSCMKAMSTDAMGKCLAPVAPKPPTICDFSL